MSRSSLTFFERVEHRAARRVLRMAKTLAPLLPKRLKRAVDDVLLHPEIQLLLAMREAIGSVPLSSLTVAAARAQIVREARVHAGEEVPVKSVRDLQMETPNGVLRARHYVPLEGPAKPPLLVFFHGGGFVVGDLDTHDGPCRVLSRDAQVQVLAIDYRLAPEHPFPAAVDDALSAYRWARENAATLGADPDRIAVGGDSAGGNLAAVVTLQCAASGIPLPAAQLLIYPSVDRTQTRRSIDLFAEGLFFTRSELDWYTERYLGGFANLGDYRVSPMLAASHAGLSHAIVVTAGFDPLRDEGEAYAALLEREGTPMTPFRADELVHGFINMGPLSPASQAALTHVARLLRNTLKSQRLRSGSEPRRDAHGTR
jgi:acetyl esterase